MTDAGKKVFELTNNFDVVMARQYARELARTMGFGLTDQTRIATAVSEVARRALDNQGQISFSTVADGPRQGIECVCVGCQWKEAPPGQPTGEVLGGLRGIERLMDDFELRQQEDERTTVVMRKWLKVSLDGGSGGS